MKNGMFFFPYMPNSGFIVLNLNPRMGYGFFNIDIIDDTIFEFQFTEISQLIEFINIIKESLEIIDQLLSVPKENNIYPKTNITVSSNNYKVTFNQIENINIFITDVNNEYKFNDKPMEIMLYSTKVNGKYDCITELKKQCDAMINSLNEYKLNI